MSTSLLPVIRLNGVGRQHRVGPEVIHALIDASLDLLPNEIHALVGPSGSGKTTLLNLVTGAEVPDTGEVHRPSAADRWDRVAFVPQGIGLLPDLTLAENIGLPMRLGCPSNRPLDEVIAGLGLSGLDDRFPSEVSLGEQQRAAVARAVVAGPAVLVADEPTAHQDEAHAGLVMAEFRRLAAGGSSILLATHERRILAVVDRVTFLADGRIAQQPPTV